MIPPEQREEKLFLPDPEPEGVAMLIAAVFGFVIGLGAAGLLYVQLHGLSLFWAVPLFTLVPVAFAYASARWGRSFWTELWDAIC